MQILKKRTWHRIKTSSLDCFYVFIPFQSDLFSSCNINSPRITEQFWISIFRNPKKFFSEHYVCIFLNGMFTGLRDAKQPGGCRVIDFGFLTKWREINRTKVVTFFNHSNQFQFTFLTDVLSRSKKEIAKTKLFSGTCWVQFWLSCWVFLPEVQYLFPLKSKNFFLKLKTNHLLFKKILNMFVSLTSILPNVSSYKNDFFKNFHIKKNLNYSKTSEGKKLVLDNLLERQFSTYVDGLKKYGMLWKFKQLIV